MIARLRCSFAAQAGTYLASVQKTPQGLSVVPKSHGEHLYDRASDEAGRIYFYARQEGHPSVCD
ncbi:MAG TPA: hypothetical protein VGP76_13180 [Planctomycetaceae bacterium]|nr:hypothetical protein [Planctomycetaceae bacterium]